VRLFAGLNLPFQASCINTVIAVINLTLQIQMKIRMDYLGTTETFR
jgi:hypothetical protein